MDLRPTTMTQMQKYKMKQHSFSIEGCKQTKLTKLTQQWRVRMVRCLLCSSRSSRRNRLGSHWQGNVSSETERWRLGWSGGSLWVAFPEFFERSSCYFGKFVKSSHQAKLHGISLSLLIVCFRFLLYKTWRAITWCLVEAKDPTTKLKPCPVQTSLFLRLYRGLLPFSALEAAADAVFKPQAVVTLTKPARRPLSRKPCMCWTTRRSSPFCEGVSGMIWKKKSLDGCFCLKRLRWKGAEWNHVALCLYFGWILKHILENSSVVTGPLGNLVLWWGFPDMLSMF